MSAVKLSERAMLATLSISTYTGMMTDREVTEEVNETFKADKKQAGRYNKRLIHSKFLQGVSGAHNNARKVHRLLTLPWEDDGTRILTTKGYIAYTEQMRKCRQKVEEEVKLFVEGLPEYIEEAKTRLGDMFNAEDYPDKAELASKFAFDIEIKPVPDSGDFRAKLTDDQVKTIVKDIEKRSDDRIKAAMNNVFDRTIELVEKLSQRLKDVVPTKDGSKSKGIRDSVVYDIYEFAQMIPSLNLTDDPRLEKLRQELTEELVEHSPEILRTDAKVRAQTIAKADKILKKVEAWKK